MHLFIAILPAAFVLLLASLWRIQGGHAAEEVSIPTPSAKPNWHSQQGARRLATLSHPRWSKTRSGTPQITSYEALTAKPPNHCATRLPRLRRRSARARSRRARGVPALLVVRRAGISTCVRAMAETVRPVRLAEKRHRQLTMPAAMDAQLEGCENRSHDGYRRGGQRRSSTRAQLPARCPPARARACRRLHPARLAVPVTRMGDQHREPVQLAALSWRVEIGPNQRRVHLVYGTRFRRIGQGTRKSLSWRASAPTTERGSS